MALIPAGFVEAVVPIGFSSSGGVQWIGTGFLVSASLSESSDQSFVFLVTNKHVFQHLQVATIQITTAKGVHTINISLVNAGVNRYSTHPPPDVDVCEVLIPGQAIEIIQPLIFSFALHKHCLNLQKMKASGIAEGSAAFQIGFPLGLVNQKHKEPFVRGGCISRIESCYSNSSPSYFCDMQTFPGSSGSPIVNKPELISIVGTSPIKTCNLIGILSGHIPYEDSLISQQTGEVMMKTQENSGLTVVFPVDTIIDVLKIEAARCHLSGIDFSI